MLVLALAVTGLSASVEGQQQFPPGTRGDSPVDRFDPIVTGDIDGDLDVDVVHLQPFSVTTGRIGILRNSGDGRLNGVTGAITSLDSRIRSLHLADIDGDGDLDVIAGALSSMRARGWLYVFENDGRGSFRDITKTALPAVYIGASQILTSDVDGDGDLDIFVGSNYRLPDVLLQNDGGGIFTDVSATALPQTMLASWSAAPGDIDGDGDVDIVIVGTSVRVYRNDGKGVFTETQGVPVQQFSGKVRLADIDGDRDLDLLFASMDLFVHRNDGTGSFTAVTTTGLPRGTNSLLTYEVGDFDGDGDVDVWAGNIGLDELYVNDGTGSFSATPARVAGLPGVTRQVAVFDMDLDGDLDVLQIQARVGRPGEYDAVQRINHHRQAIAAATAARGGTYALELFSQPGYATGAGGAWPFLGLTNPRVVVPGLGVLGLDPAAMLPLPRVAIPAATGRGSLRVAVPNDPQLAGVRFHVQALIVNPGPGAGLSTTIETRIF